MFIQTALRLFLLSVSVTSLEAQQQTKSNLRKRLVSGDPSTTASGDRSLIINGIVADADHFPYYAAYRHVSTVDNPETSCGGVVVSKRFILTAAHCIYDDTQKDDMYWEILNQSGERHGSRYFWKDYSVHENYDPVTLENDIAIIELDADVTTAYPRLSNKFLKGGSHSGTLTAVGMGDTIVEKSNSDSYELLKHQLRYVNTDTCIDWISGENIAIQSLQKHTHFCAQSDSGGVCHGDSGGPLVREGNSPWEDVLEGLVSYGKRGCSGNLPAMFTRISEYYDWIKHVMCDHNANALPSYMGSCSSENFYVNNYAYSSNMEDIEEDYPEYIDNENSIPDEDFNKGQYMEEIEDPLYIGYSSKMEDTEEYYPEYVNNENSIPDEDFNEGQYIEEIEDPLYMCYSSKMEDTEEYYPEYIDNENSIPHEDFNEGQYIEEIEDPMVADYTYSSNMEDLEEDYPEYIDNENSIPHEDFTEGQYLEEIEDPMVADYTYSSNMEDLEEDYPEYIDNENTIPEDGFDEGQYLEEIEEPMVADYTYSSKMEDLEEDPEFIDNENTIPEEEIENTDEEDPLYVENESESVEDTQGYPEDENATQEEADTNEFSSEDNANDADDSVVNPMGKVGEGYHDYYTTYWNFGWRN